MVAQVQAAARARALPARVLCFEPQPRELFDPQRAPARLSSLGDKARRLAALGVDGLHVCRFDAQFAALPAADFVQRVLVDTLQVRWLLVGDDFRFGARRSGDLSLLQDMGAHLGFEVTCLDTVALDAARISSTRVRDTLQAGDLAATTALLGRPYRLSGRVVAGDKLGRELGFPTANLHLGMPRPALSGIFVVTVSGAGLHQHPAVASLGVRPTVKTGGQPTLEVYLMDFSGNLYGQRLCVDFLHKLRDEEKFTDLGSLITQMHRDVARARDYFAERTVPQHG
jgi:riboflavin kinase/FMN adenylyltransferase